MERETRPYLRPVKGGAQMKEPRNKPGRAIWLLLLMVLGAAISSPQPSLQGRAGKQSDSVVRLAAMPLSFEPNQGQLREKVRFFAAGGRSALYLAEDEAVFALRESAASTTL